MDFPNCYQDEQRAAAYAKLEFPGTYYLAYRDLPEIISTHVKGRQALDFGCGTGRSTRFLQRLGFNVTGIDIAPDMIRKAKALDPYGEYRLVNDGDFQLVHGHSFDLVLSVFTFDNIPTRERKVSLLREMGHLLSPEGYIVNLVSSPEIYTHEWASFSTKDFPQNRTAHCGDIVRIVNTDIEDRRPIEDILWPDDAYRKIYHEARLTLVASYSPLATVDEPFQWVNETKIAPWTIYVLRNAS